MSSVVNHAIIEGMVTMTLGHKPRVLWQSASIDSQHVVNSLTRTAVHLPEVPDDIQDFVLEQYLGLGLLCVQAHGLAKQGLWPESGLQREAVSALEVGMASKSLMARAPFLRSKVQALAEKLQDEPVAEASEDVQLLQTFITTALRVGLAYNTDGDQLAAELRECEGTEDYVALVQRWVPQASPATMAPPSDPEDGEQGEATGSEESGDSSGSNGVDQSPQGDGNNEQPPSGEEGGQDTAEASQGAAAGQPDQGEEPGVDPSGGSSGAAARDGATDTPRGAAAPHRPVDPLGRPDPNARWGTHDLRDLSRRRLRPEDR